MPIKGDAPIRLRSEAHDAAIRFAWCLDGATWHEIGPALDASRPSDAYATRTVASRITDWGYAGSVFALAVQDLTGAGLTVDFDLLDCCEL